MAHIRQASAADLEPIRYLHRCSFSESERELVATLAIGLLNETSIPASLSLIAESDGAIAGHVAFSPLAITPDANWLGYLLSPLGVAPEYQRRGIGSQLVAAGIQRLTAQGVDAVFVYGDPAYYGRFGFTAEAAGDCRPPHELTYPLGWQALCLGEGRPPRGTLCCVRPLRDPALW